MGLSRLDNFIKNVRGDVLYVSPNDIDATDSIENKGNSLTRPFKTIQRALIEAARFSYQRGLNNDRFNRTTIVLSSGDHVIDNRPGFIPDGSANFILRNGTTTNDFSAWDLTTVYDLTNPNNALYKLNSIHGGVIIPRGTSIVGMDVRKTRIRPKYVPSPTNANIPRSAIFRLTGGCYFHGFSVLDADPNDECFTDYSLNEFLANFSHNKLAVFEFADGTNAVQINDAFQTYGTSRTDLDMYYEKVGLAYGSASGRQIEPDYPSSSLDIQSKVDEYRIVGPSGLSVGITSIRAGTGLVTSEVITVTTSSAITGLDVDTPVTIRGISEDGYNGKYIVTEKVSSTEFRYEVQNSPLNALPSVTGSTVSLTADSVTSASPYINGVSMRSVYGMCGMHADGSKSSGFKSMVVAQFTGIGLQKDENAFVKYNSTTGAYDDSTISGNQALSSDSRAVYKPDYANFHIKCSNKSYLQVVNCFAVGYAEHFVTENGGDMSLTGCNSNFGARSLVATGFRDTAFSQDDLGYITHVLPPKEVPIQNNTVEFLSLDIQKSVGIGTTNERLYLAGETNSDVPPAHIAAGFRVGAKVDDELYLSVPNGGNVAEYRSRIVMQNSQTSSEKVFRVGRSSAGINSITSSVLTLSSVHNFENAESVRVLSDNGRLPDGLEPNRVYFAITDTNASSGLSTNVDIKLANTASEAEAGNAITINNLGGVLKIVSRVSDKKSGDVGHPIQYDNSLNQWYIKVSTASTDNQIQPNVVVGLGTTALGNLSPRTYVKRKLDTRKADDTIYRLRYVIPASSGGSVAVPPTDGFVIQESSTGIGGTNSEVQTYYGSGSIIHINQQRNFNFIANARWIESVSEAQILTELPHNLSRGSQVELVNIQSGVNTTGVGNSGFNRIYQVTGISSAREFTVGLNTNPGAFSNNLLTRDTNLPYFKRSRYNTTYFVQKSEEIQQYVSGAQDGIYYLTVLNASNSPTISPFTGDKFSQPVKELYPQVDRDTPVADPNPSISFASPTPNGEVVTDDIRNSITKETLNKFISDLDVGVGAGLTDVITSVGGTIHQIRTLADHGLNRITQVSIANSGSGYGTGVIADYYNAKLVSIGASVTGSNATAKVTVDATGGITDILIMDGGSAYGIGNTMNVVGIATTTGHSPAVVTVQRVYDNVGDTLQIIGVGSETYRKYNNLYRILDVQVGAAKSFVATSINPVTGVSTAGIGTSKLGEAAAYLTGQSIGISSITYDSVSGIATVNTRNNHGLKPNTKINIRTGITTMPVFTGNFIIKQNKSLTSFTVDVGAGATISKIAIGSSMFAHRNGFSSNEGDSNPLSENLNGRMTPVYAGITTTLSVGIADASTTSLSLTNVGNLGVNIGDYLAIDDEIVRIKSTPTNPATNPLTVFRGVFGTNAVSHSAGAVVRKIKPFAIEFRKYSNVRAEGHTWEHIGFGPGNYSTALPVNQDRSRTEQEQSLARSLRKDGGGNFFSGVDERGFTFSGHTKSNSVTGDVRNFTGPIRSVTGEDISNREDVNVTKATEGTFTRSIRVEGGRDGKTISEFNGPVLFKDKITSNSSEGIESKSLLLEGDSALSRRYTVGIATPVNAGIPGDIIYYDKPEQGGYVGWVYTQNKDWKRFGSISLDKNSNIQTFDQVGIATTSLTNRSVLRIGAGTSLVSVDYDGVGIGTTANGKKLRVVGEADYSSDIGVGGTVTALAFVGDGQGLTNLNVSATGWAQVSGVGNTGIYDAALSRVGIGTSVPTATLELGAPGSGVIDLEVNNRSVFVGVVSATNMDVTGIFTATNYRLDGSGSNIKAGIVTTSTLVVGTAGTVITTTSTQRVGIGTLSPRAKLDIEGSVKFKTYSENIESVSPSGGNVNIDLQKGQTFALTVNSAISQFTLLNAPTGATSFVLKIAQDSTGGWSVGIDTFKNSGGVAIPVYWSGGSVPGVATTALEVDIYRFRTFDQGATLYGTVEGQRFS